jgi:hypothetical protein
LAGHPFKGHEEEVVNIPSEESSTISTPMLARSGGSMVSFFEQLPFIHPNEVSKFRSFEEQLPFIHPNEVAVAASK